MEELHISNFLSVHEEPYVGHLKYLCQRIKLQWNHVKNKSALRAKTCVSNREKQFSHVLTHESSHTSQPGPRITSGKILFCKLSGLDHTTGRHLTWLSCQLPGSCFPSLFIRYLKQQYLIPLLFSRKKSPREGFSVLFPLKPPAAFCLCITSSVQIEVNPENNFLAF